MRRRGRDPPCRLSSRRNRCGRLHPHGAPEPASKLPPTLRWSADPSPVPRTSSDKIAPAMRLPQMPSARRNICVCCRDPDWRLSICCLRPTAGRRPRPPPQLSAGGCTPIRNSFPRRRSAQRVPIPFAVRFLQRPTRSRFIRHSFSASTPASSRRRALPREQAVVLGPQLHGCLQSGEADQRWPDIDVPSQRVTRQLRLPLGWHEQRNVLGIA